MELFSEREGFKPSKVNIQEKSMDNDLRVGLWNAFFIQYLDQFKKGRLITQSKYLLSLLQNIWGILFKKTVDDIPINYNDALERIKNHFFPVNGVKFMISSNLFH